MGVNLSLRGAKQGDHDTDLCTNHGYFLLAAWLESLPEKDYPSLHALAETGLYRPTDELVDELDRAIANEPPENPDVLHTANRLAELLGDGDPGETMGIMP